MQRSESTGLLYALAGFTLLSLGDAVIKSMTGMWPPTAIAATRYVLGAIGLAAVLHYQQGAAAFRMPRPWVQALRGGGVAMATVGFFSALLFMPLAEVTAITFASPMLTAFLAAVFLREPVRRETVVASLVAFGGVMIVLRPNIAEAGAAALLPLMSAFGMSLVMIGNRLAAGTGSALAMQVFISGLAAPILVVATLAGHVSGLERLAVDWPHWSVIARCAVVACSASMAHLLIYMGTARAGASAVAPMTYVQLLVSLAVGWLIFGERTDAMALAGSAIIVGAGLFLWWSGRRREG